jgi:CRP-like cAMP-binding protein
MYRNRILAALPADELERINPFLERVDLQLKHVLIDPNRPIEHVYFVEEGIVSILGVMEDGTAVETATVGNEGMVGVPVFLGTDRMAAQAFTQVSGWGHRLPAEVLRQELSRGGELGRLLGSGTIPSPLDSVEVSQDGISTAGEGAPADPQEVAG